MKKYISPTRKLQNKRTPIRNYIKPYQQTKKMQTFIVVNTINPSLNPEEYHQSSSVIEVLLERPGFGSNNNQKQSNTHHINRLQYHSFRKFKTWSFNFNHILSQGYNSFKLTQSIDFYTNYKNGNDMIVLVLGTQLTNLSEICLGTNNIEGFFYSIMAKFITRLQKDKSAQVLYKYNLESCYILQQTLYDCGTQQIIEIMENKSDKIGSYDFAGSKKIPFTSVYQLYHRIKEMTATRKKNIPVQAILIMTLTVQCEMGQFSYKQKYLFLEWKFFNKDSPIATKNTNTLLVLNQCILSLYKKTDQQIKDEKDNELKAPFRNSKLTRILKPYLLNCSKNLVLGCINNNEIEEDSNLQILMLINHLAKLQTPINTKNPYLQRLQQQKQQKMQQLLQQNQQMKKSLQLIKQKQHKDIYALDKLLAATAQQQKKIQEQIENLQTSIYLLTLQQTKRKLIEGVNNNNSSTIQQIELNNNRKIMLEKVQQRRLLQQKKIKQILQVEQSKKSRIYGLKKYYTNLIQNQDIRRDLFQKSSQKRKKALRTIICTLDQLTQEHHWSSKNNSIKIKKKSLNTQQKLTLPIRENNNKDPFHPRIKTQAVVPHQLPKFSRSLQRRRQILKDKVRLGRVDERNFLDQYAQKYKKYAIKSKE